MIKSFFKNKKLLIFGLLFTIAFVERTLFDLGPNIELVTTALVLSSFYLGRKSSFGIILALLITTDLILGNSNIFLFTWTGFLVPALFSDSLLKKLAAFFKLKKTNLFQKTTTLTTAGLATNTFFYIWTNFGVWLLDSWGMYSNGLKGLVASYINGLPFLKYQLTSSIIFVPLIFLTIEGAFYLLKTLKLTKAYFLDSRFHA